MFPCPLSFTSVPQSCPPPPPHTHTPFQLWRPFASKLAAASLRSVPLLPIPTGVGSRSPVPPSPRSQHPRATLAAPRHIYLPTLPRHPDPRTQTHPCPRPSTTRPGSHLGGSAAAAQKAALLQLGSGCCSRLLLLLLLLPSSPRCPRPDQGRCHRRCSYGVRVHGCQPQLSPPTPRPQAPSSLGLNSRSFQGPRPGPPPGRTRPERGMLRWSRGLLKEPAAAIRHVPGSSLVVRAPHLPAGGDLERSHPRP